MMVVDAPMVTGFQWVTRSFGNINNLVKEQVEIPPPSPNEVCISVRAIGVNYADIFAILGLYTLPRLASFTPGFEVSGTVYAVGSDVDAYQVGDRVIGLTRFGGYATIVKLHQNFVHPLEEDWSFAQGAAWPCQALTAWYVLCVLGGLNKGACRLLASPDKRVIVHSAAGGVGLMLVDLIRYIGGDVLATVGSAEKVAVLLQRGLSRDQIIIRGKDDSHGFEKAVRQRLNVNAGVDVIVDPVMGRYFHEGWRLLNRGGRYVVMGASSLMPTKKNPDGKKTIRSWFTSAWRYCSKPRLDTLASIKQRNRSVNAFNMGDMFDCSEELKGGFDELSEMGLQRPFIGRSFVFDDVHDALHTFRNGHTVGKIVLLVEE